MKIIAYDPFIEETSNLWNGVTKVSLDELLRSSDVVSIHTPLNENTHHLINSENLKLLKQTNLIKIILEKLSNNIMLRWQL